MVRIAVASLQQESNSLSPIISLIDDFDIAYGSEMFAKIHVLDLAREAGAELVPALYAHALPGGPLAKTDFLKLAGDIIDRIPNDIDGLWLYLHGALYVEEIGSGEAYLLQKIREKIGVSVPVSAALDFHANNTDEFVSLCNCICGFRTAPHTDQIGTERKAMRLLLNCIKKKLLPEPALVRANVIVPGDCVQTSLPPLAAIMARADEIETRPGVLCAQVFNGQAWVDTPYTGPSMVVTCESDKSAAAMYAGELADLFYNARHDFRFMIEAVPASEAIRLSMEARECPVFLSDSGDNTTAGAAGDNAFLLNRLLASNARGVLVAGIADEKACAACFDVPIGAGITVRVGGSLDPRSESAEISGIMKNHGRLLGYTGADAGKAAVVDCENITVIITENRTAFTTREIFNSININPLDYKIVAVKLGYLYPDIAALSKRSILVLTPGSSTERLEDMGHKNIRRPMFPLDDNFIKEF
jgi:microcystin degradation protein MlrC